MTGRKVVICDRHTRWTSRTPFVKGLWIAEEGTTAEAHCDGEQVTRNV